MMNKLVPQEPATLACEVCLREIPNSATMSSEAAEYAQHYCGIECYQQWLEAQYKTPLTDQRTLSAKAGKR